jgi:hypothetical protein
MTTTARMMQTVRSLFRSPSLDRDWVLLVLYIHRYSLGRSTGADSVYIRYETQRREASGSFSRKDEHPVVETMVYKQRMNTKSS